MNQTKKRLHIIKLAISITDTDCIQHQLLKLSQLKSDPKLQKILAMLHAKNYGQAQGMIIDYINTPMEKILQKGTIDNMQSELTQNLHREDESEEFSLSEASKKEKPKIKEFKDAEDIEKFLREEPPPTKVYKNNINYDSLLSLEASDIFPDKGDEDAVSSESDPFFNEESREITIHKEDNEALFATESVEEYALTEEAYLDQALPVEHETALEEEGEDLSVSSEEEVPTKPSYPPIPYIEKKFSNLLKQYPPIEQNPVTELSVTALLEKIKTEPHNDNEIDEVVNQLIALTQQGNKSEAAKLLLICASTPSAYAQFMLGRALFKGEILQKNIPEAFRIIYSLAKDKNYPEAVCDLAQLYEYGIGVEKDILKAESLYQEAMEQGIRRAQKHLERIRRENRTLFSRFK